MLESLEVRGEDARGCKLFSHFGERVCEFKLIQGAVERKKRYKESFQLFCDAVVCRGVGKGFVANAISRYLLAWNEST